MASTGPQREIRRRTHDYYLYSSDSESSSFEPPFEELLEDVPLDEDLLDDDGIEKEAERSAIVCPPTPASILETKASIEAQASQLALIDAEYKETESKLQTIEATREEIRNSLAKNKAYLARVRVLPQEILGFIFLFYMSDHTQSPWTLMHVTRTWRKAALATHAIWARIRITSPAWQKVGAERRKDGREVCGTGAQLYRALQRTGNAPLDLQFAFVNPKPTRTYRQHDHLAFKQMLTLLARSKKCSDVRALEIDGPDYAHLEEWGEYGGTLILPELRRLCVKQLGYADFALKLAKTSTKVGEVEFKLGTYRSSGQVGFECLAMIHSLVSLSINCTHLRSYSHDIEKLRQFLANARSLITLELISFGFKDGSSSYRIRVPNLQTLVMKDSDICPMDLPNLVHLSLIDQGKDSKEGYEVWENNFGSLQSLTIVSSYSEIGDMWCSDITFPPLHTLDICFGSWEEGHMEISMNPKRFNPVVFRLRKTRLPTDSLLQLIGSMDRLEELELEGIALKKRFFTYLAQESGRTSDCEGSCDEVEEEGEGEPKREEGKKAVNCPRLVRVRIELKAGPLTRNERMKRMASGAAMARVEAGVPMEWLIRWSGDEKWMDCLH